MWLGYYLVDCGCEEFRCVVRMICVCYHELENYWLRGFEVRWSEEVLDVGVDV